MTLRSLREQGSEKSLDCECTMLPLICCDVFDGIGAELCLDFDAGLGSAIDDEAYAALP